MYNEEFWHILYFDTLVSWQDGLDCVQHISLVAYLFVLFNLCTLSVSQRQCLLEIATVGLLCTHSHYLDTLTDTRRSKSLISTSGWQLASSFPEFPSEAPQWPSQWAWHRAPRPWPTSPGSARVCTARTADRTSSGWLSGYTFHDALLTWHLLMWVCRELFSKQRQLVIPLIQRRYCWHGETVWKWFEVGFF